MGHASLRYLKTTIATPLVPLLIVLSVRGPFRSAACVCVAIAWLAVYVIGRRRTPTHAFRVVSCAILVAAWALALLPRSLRDHVVRMRTDYMVASSPVNFQMHDEDLTVDQVLHSSDASFLS